jgi:peptide-methionine (S)-S-oxide reductase
MGNTYEMATLGGGCFWCLEAVYLEVKGITEIVSGYTGGSIPEPSYEDICTGSTGHAEVVQLKFDLNEIGFQDILNIFFSIHDPTTLNRQGNDVGTQYRSVIFYHSENQMEVSLNTIKKLTEDELWTEPIVTDIKKLGTFYRAEDYHQNYYQLNPNNPYCQFVISPKLAKFRQQIGNK